MSITPWKVLETKHLHDGIRVDTCELPNGHALDAHVLEYDDEIMVFALTQEQEVVLIKQYRHGVQETILELPGGSVDKGETPLEAAKRELMEETGYISESFIKVGHGSPNPAIYTNTIHYFLALGVEQIRKHNADDAENIEISLVPLLEVIAMAKRGDLIHSLNITALFYVQQYLDQIS